MRLYPAVSEKYQRNLDIVTHPSFVAYMVDNIPTDCQFRIHVSGDFHHRDYVKKWIEICATRKDVTFYAYTRSWRVPDIWYAILSLDDLDNVNINLSVDNETGRPRSVYAADMRWCYLTKTDNVPSWIRHDDIVFRSNHLGQKKRRKNDIKKGIDPDIRSPIVKRLGGQVCPKEQGLDVPKLSCATCRLCVDKPEVLHAV
jgi:hypothetical protein